MKRDGHKIKKTTIELDLTELDEAKRVLGTATARETVDTALREVNRRAALARAAAFVESGQFEVVTPDQLADLRAVQTA